ncbi:MAG TPA: hypothetical protein VMV10_02920 [Pirellulales bacterium]|nr:hypothetical protein [Pirellulales bacterium]
MQQVSVRVADMHRAKPIVLAHAADSHDSSRYRKPRMVTWTRIGKGCGFVLGAVIAAVWAWTAGMSEPLTYAVFDFLGGLLGLMAGAAIGFLAGTIADA